MPRWVSASLALAALLLAVLDSLRKICTTMARTAC
jgi:hypothetical protein